MKLTFEENKIDVVEVAPVGENIVSKFIPFNSTGTSK